MCTYTHTPYARDSDKSWHHVLLQHLLLILIIKNVSGFVRVSLGPLVAVCDNGNHAPTYVRLLEVN